MQAKRRDVKATQKQAKSQPAKVKKTPEKKAKAPPAAPPPRKKQDKIEKVEKVEKPEKAEKVAQKKVAKSQPAKIEKKMTKGKAEEKTKAPTEKQKTTKASQKTVDKSDLKTGKANKKAEEESVVDTESTRTGCNDVKPKKVISPWLFFNTETVNRLKTLEGYSQKEAFSKSAELWKALTEKEKAPYVKKSQADQVRYDKQVEEYNEQGWFTMADGQKSSEVKIDLKKRFGKNATYPKRPLSAYLCFTQAMSNSIKEKEKIEKHTDVMKRMGVLWTEMSAKEKKKFNDMHDKDVIRYENQIEEMETNGYFLMDDGTKSTDHQKKEKKKRQKPAKADETEDEESSEEQEEEEEEEEKPKKRQKASNK